MHIEANTRTIIAQALEILCFQKIDKSVYLWKDGDQISVTLLDIDLELPFKKFIQGGSYIF